MGAGVRWWFTDNITRAMIEDIISAISFIMSSSDSVSQLVLFGGFFYEAWTFEFLYLGGAQF